MKNEKRNITFHRFYLLLLALACLLSYSSFSQKPLFGKGWTIVDTTGKICATALDYKDIQDFRNGAVKAESSNGLFCLLNAYGFQISSEYYELDYNGEGAWRFKEDKLYGLIDSRGKSISGAAYEWIGEFGNGLAPVSINDTAAYIDGEGRVIFPFIFEVATSFSNGAAAVKKNDRWGIIDTAGRDIPTREFAQLGQIRYNRAPFSEDKRTFGYVDTSGEVVIAPRFTYAEPFGKDGLATVSECAPRIGDYGRREFIHTFSIDTAGNRVDDPERYSVSTSKTPPEEGFAALYIENSQESRPDVQGLSPWGTYLAQCTMAYGTQAAYDLTFEKLKHPIRIKEENTFAYTLSLGQPGYEVFKLTYIIRNGNIYLSRVDKGIRSFRTEEMLYQEDHGVGFHDTRDALQVVIDQFLFLVQPHLLLRQAGPEALELKPEGILYMDGVVQQDYTKHEVVEFSKGQSYQGEMNGKNPEGFGKLTYAGGTEHYGSFLENTIKGWGLRLYSNRTAYLGMFEDGREEGYGILRYGDGTLMKGTFREGEPEGRVLRKTPDGQIEWLVIAEGRIVSTEVLRQHPGFRSIGIAFKYFPAKRGFIIEKVNPGSPAAAAGVTPGDKLIRVDGTTLVGNDTKKVEELLAGPEGSAVTVTLEREGARMELSIIRKL